ncbi:MAG TPA: hypothetical protein VJU84_05615 [Pyrinomonadaceae bacterium]|nr:hypothetical protein [Pyrinomonadaceae bacterium]
MNRLLVAFTVVVLMCQAILAQPSVQSEQPIAPAPTGLALEITYFKTLPPAYSPVAGSCCKPGGAWYALFGRIPADASQPASLPVQAVDVRSKVEGEFVRVLVSVFLGDRFHETKEEVATYELKENEGVRAVGLTKFGVEPFDIKVVRVNPNLSYTPSVLIKAPSISVVGIELKNTTLPSYKLTLHNTSNKNVVAIAVNVLADNKVRASSLPQGIQGRILIEAGGTEELTVNAAYQAQKTTQGYRPEPQPNQEIVINSVVFDDGSFEGDAQMAATFTAFVAGRKIQTAKLIALMDSTLKETNLNVPAALEKLKTQAELLSTDAEPSVIDQLRSSFPRLTISESNRLKTSVDVALQGVKFDFVQSVKEFEKRNTSNDRDFRAWLTATKSLYERWLSRLSSGSTGYL